MDFTPVDEVRQVSDRDSFVMARRLVREEGLYAGGSSGSAVAAAVQVARELGPGKLVVTVLPDAATRYVSTFLSDSWMKDNGFLEPAADPYGTVAEMLGQGQALVSARIGETVGDVVERMRNGGISQVPVVKDDGRCVGMIHEVDVLSNLLEGHSKLETPIDEVVQPLQGIVGKGTPVRRLIEIFNQDNIAVVLDDERPVAVVTKIDLIDYLSRAS